MIHRLSPSLEESIKVQQSNMRRSYVLNLLLLLIGVATTCTLIYINAGNEILKVGPTVITTTIGALQFVHTSPGRERLASFKHAKLLLESPDTPPELMEKVEKIVLGVLEDIMKRNSK